MMYEIRFRPEAENDIEDASVWYESQRQGLGQARFRGPSCYATTNLEKATALKKWLFFNALDF